MANNSSSEKNDIPPELQRILDQNLVLLTLNARLQLYDELVRCLKKDVKNVKLKKYLHDEVLPHLIQDLQQDTFREVVSLLGISVQVCRLDTKTQETIITTLSNQLSSCRDKATCRNALWCLANIKLWPETPDTILRALLDVSLLFTSQNALVQSVSIVYEAFNVLVNINNHKKAFIEQNLEDALTNLLPWVFDENENILKVALGLLSEHSPSLTKDETLIADVLKQIKSIHLPKLLNFAKSSFLHTVSIWEFTVDILKTSLLKPGLADTLNMLLKIEETLLKSSNLKLRHQALKAWKKIIALFTETEKDRKSSSKLQLLTVPLKYVDKHPGIAGTKLELWWFVIERLGALTREKFEELVLPFLLFCFGSDGQKKGVVESHESLSFEVLSALACVLDPEVSVTVNSYSRQNEVLTNEKFAEHIALFEGLVKRAICSAGISESTLVLQLVKCFEFRAAKSGEAGKMSEIKEEATCWWLSKAGKEPTIDVFNRDFTLFPLKVFSGKNSQAWEAWGKFLSSNSRILKENLPEILTALKDTPFTAKSRALQTVSFPASRVLADEIERDPKAATEFLVNCLRNVPETILCEILKNLKLEMKKIGKNPKQIKEFWKSFADTMGLNKLSLFGDLFPELSDESRRKRNEDFVIVSTPPEKKSKRVLTEHQKEVMRSRKLLSSIPAMYNDYSQSNSQLLDPETQSQMELPATGTLEEDTGALLEPPKPGSYNSNRKDSGGLRPCVQTSTKRSSSDSCDIFTEDATKLTAEPKVSSVDPHTLSCTTQDLLQTPQLNPNSEHPIYPALLECQDPLDPILMEIAAPLWKDGIKELLKSRNVTTVGQLASLTELIVNQLPFKTPQFRTVTKALEKYEKSLKDNKGTDKSCHLTVDGSCENGCILVKLLNYEGPGAVVQRTALEEIPLLVSSLQISPANNWAALFAQTAQSCELHKRQGLAGSLHGISSGSVKFQAFHVNDVNRSLCPEIVYSLNSLREQQKEQSPDGEALKIVKISTDSACCCGGQEILVLVDLVHQGEIKAKFVMEDNSEFPIIYADCRIHQDCGISFTTPAYPDQQITSPVRAKLQLFCPGDEIASNSVDFYFLPQAAAPTKAWANLPKDELQQQIEETLSTHPQGKQILRDLILNNLK